MGTKKTKPEGKPVKTPAPRRKVKGLFGKGSYVVHDHECKYCGSKCECHVDTCKTPYLSDCNKWWPTTRCFERLRARKEKK
jgi:hypothetical protein